jgi:hypothetical protein
MSAKLRFALPIRYLAKMPVYFQAANSSSDAIGWKEMFNQ